jgi:nicotinamide phosphoribosyltransferase
LAVRSTRRDTKYSLITKVLNGVGVIQGDGINIGILENIAVAVQKSGYSSQNVAYGMGGDID